MSIWNCQACGAQVPEDSRFCPNCGREVASPSTRPPEQPERLQRQRGLIKTQKPIVGGILIIVAGAFLVLLAATLLPIAIIPAIVAVVGGIFAIRRRVWGLSLAGAICAVPVMLGIPTITLLALSRSEFSRVSRKGKAVLYASLAVVVLVIALVGRSTIPGSEVAPIPPSGITLPESAPMDVVTVSTGTVDRISGLSIGLGDIRRDNYVDSGGVRRYGLVGVLLTLVHDSKMEVALQVYPGLVDAVDRYVICVDEIEFYGTPSLLTPPGSSYGSIRLSVYTLTAPISSMSGDLSVTINSRDVGISGADVVSQLQPQGQTSVKGVTDITGRVGFAGIKAGRYQFTISCPGFETATVELNFIPEVTRNITISLRKS